ncbi:MAG: rhodanese-related sulfurtransferase [Candidatus Nanopelagicaceae bacterium]|nr:rhodanese-related sulfurtransferase [Candidatus Nanopelagicaceae bacterium]
MELQKVILYYGFTPISDPEAIRLWQQTLCESLGLNGRILISPHGINGTLGGNMSALKKYVKATKAYPGFKKIDFKWSDGEGNDFPRLKVRVRDELVAFGNPTELEVDENGVVGGGVHLKPYDVEKLVKERGDDVIFFDGRNAFEAKIGKFRNAVVPDVTTSRDFVGEIESGKYDHLKERPIVTYCTGGIRCEVLSSVMKRRGFKEVYQIEGGIVRYGKKYGDSSLWEGSLYTFDARMAVDFSENTKIIGECEKCSAATKQFYNCANVACHELVLLCESCAKNQSNMYCSHDLTKPSQLDSLPIG